MALATLTEFKAHLNLRTSGSTTDPELQGFLDAATPVIENITGPVVPQTVTGEVHDGGNGNRLLFALRLRPVISVTSVTEYANGVATVLAQVANPALGTLNSFTLESATGIITRRNAGGDIGRFPAGVDNILVTYIAGYATVPDNVKLAAMFQAAHMFQSSQLGGRRQLNTAASGDDAYSWAAGFGIPNRVRELLQPHQRIPGIA